MAGLRVTWFSLAASLVGLTSTVDLRHAGQYAEADIVGRLHLRQLLVTGRVTFLLAGGACKIRNKEY